MIKIHLEYYEKYFHHFTRRGIFHNCRSLLIILDKWWYTFHRSLCLLIPGINIYIIHFPQLFYFIRLLMYCIFIELWFIVGYDIQSWPQYTKISYRQRKVIIISFNVPLSKKIFFWILIKFLLEKYFLRENVIPENIFETQGYIFLLS